MAYDCKDIDAFSGVWVFCEQRGGQLTSTDFELVGEARKLADEMGCGVSALLLGSGMEEAAGELCGYGADEVLLYDAPVLKDYTTDAYAAVVCGAVERFRPSVLLIGATSIGRDLGPRCAARLHTGLTADCTHLDVDVKKYVEFLSASSSLDLTGQRFDEEDRNLKMTRPAFGGHMMATIVCPRFRPQMSTVRPGVMKKAPFDSEAAARAVVRRLPVELGESDLRTKVLEVVKETKKLVDLVGADVVVSVGHGISANVPLGVSLAEQLAEKLGGVVGASRAAVDAGWLSADHQVGQTGKTVHPRLYIALGISGAIQHKAGMQESEYIVAVNKSEAAPIFEAADYGIAGDLFEVVPAMLEALDRAE